MLNTVKVSPSSDVLEHIDIESQPESRQPECTNEVRRTRHETRRSSVLETLQRVFIHDEINNVYVSKRPKKFPWIHCGETFAEYQKYQKSHFDIYQCIPVTVLFLFVLLNRMNIYGAGKNNGEFDAALALLILVFIMFGLFILSNLELTFQNIVLKKVIQNIKKTFLLKNIGCCICIVATTMMGMILKARTTNGLCPANTSIWGSQKCNPLAGCHSIPQGQIMLVYITPIICQLCLKGLSMRGILLSWMIGTAFVITCVLAVGGNDIWSIFYSVLFLFTAFENERYSRILFFESKKAEAAEGERQTLLFERNEAMLAVERNKFELAIISLRNNEKQSLMEKERVQLTSLIGNVAHDLKTPLQSFRMDLELLKTHIKKDNLSSRDVIFLNDDDNPRVILNSLNAACDFMTMAINRSLDFAKASGNITLVPSMETFNIATALSGPVNVIKHVQQDIKICVNPLPLKMCLTLISDKHWFSENVLCLLSNAAKYSDHGEVTVSIELLVNPASVLTDESSHGSIPRTYSNDVYDANCPSLVRVSIEDNGIGLSEEARKNLFQPFKQAQRMAGGTGLGLFSLSKRMEALGGFCGVEPRTDGKRGSNFCFAFPYRPDRSGATTEKTNGIRHSNSNVHSKTGGSEDDPKNSGEISIDDVYNILLVDDSPTIIKVTSRCLRAKGHSVTSASNGSSGLDRLIEGYATKDFHVVLMDLQMPVMDGIEAVRRYREYEQLQNQEMEKCGQQQRMKRLPIIGMSANSDNATKECALDVGMDLFIGKPFIMRELQPLLDQLNIEKNIGF